MLKQFRDTFYFCTRDGEVFSFSSGKMRRIKESTRKGYKYVQVYHDKKVFKVSSHRMIYEAWVSAIDEGLTVDHIDFDIHNNCVDNLQLLSKSENSKKKSHGNFIGKNNPRSIVTDENLIELFQMKKQGINRKIIAHQTGISKSSQIRIEKGVSYFEDTERLGLLQGSY